MNGIPRTNYFERVTRISDHRFSDPNCDSHLPDPNREYKYFEDDESLGPKMIGAPLARLGFNSVIQNAGMTFSSFVETKFIPEHVEHKTVAGRTHYQAMLKHLIRPETVQRMFNAKNGANARLHSVPGWPYLDQVRLCDLTAEHVRRLVVAAFARNYAWQTVKHIKNAAFAVIAHAQQEDCFHRVNPVSQVKLPPKTHRATPDLNMNQARAILQLLPSPEKHVAFLALSTGMKIQEICDLQWKHVNLGDSPRVLEGEVIPPYCIAVRKHWNRSGLGSTSTSRKQNIAISAPLFALLTAWVCKKGALNPEGFVLVSNSGQPILRADLQSTRLNTIGRKLSMPRLSWRVLCRAYFVSLSEFWPRLDYMIGDTTLNGAAVSHQGKEYDRSVYPQNRI